MSKRYHYRTAGEVDNGDEDDKITPRHLWDGMREHTTMHGVAHVSTAKGIIKQSFWGIAMLFTVGCLLANLGSITDTYLSWNVDVTIQILNKKELLFPSVTICNMSPIRKSYFEGISRRKRNAPNDWNTSTEIPPDSAPSPNAPCCCSCCPSGTEGGGSCSTCIENVDRDVCFASQLYTITPAPPPATYTPAPPTDVPPAPPTVPGSAYADRVAVRESFAEEEKLTETIVNLPAAEKDAAGTQLGDFILDCQYAGSDCYLADFEQFNNPTHGNCFIFNSGWKSSGRKSHKAGRRYGLMLTLNIQQDEYVKQVGDTAGIRVVVGSQNRMPFPEDEGLTVSPGHSTSISLRQVVLSRLGAQYSDCIAEQSENFERNVYEELYPVKYSNIACLKTCYQKWVMEKCGCADPYFPRVGAAFNNTDWKTCSAANLTQDDCKYGVGREFNENKLTCDCPVPCEERLFQSVVSIGEWPSDVQKDDILEKLRPKLGSLLDDPFDPEKYKRNLIKMEIYYQEFNFENIAERPAYDFFEFISNVGGTIGLWVGCSILTIVEFIEFFMDMIVLSIKKRQLRKQKPGPNNVHAVPSVTKESLAKMDKNNKPTSLPGYNDSFKNNNSKAKKKKVPTAVLR